MSQKQNFPLQHQNSPSKNNFVPPHANFFLPLNPYVHTNVLPNPPAANNSNANVPRLVYVFLWLVYKNRSQYAMNINIGLTPIILDNE